ASSRTLRGSAGLCRRSRAGRALPDPPVPARLEERPAASPAARGDGPGAERRVPHAEAIDGTFRICHDGMVGGHPRLQKPRLPGCATVPWSPEIAIDPEALLGVEGVAVLTAEIAI